MSDPDEAANSSRESAWMAVERIVDHFEEAWQRGLCPTLEDYLDGAAALRPALLVELIRADMELRSRAGHTVRAEEYLQRYPELTGQADAMAALAGWELHLRCLPEARPSGIDEALPPPRPDRNETTPAPPLLAGTPVLSTTLPTLRASEHPRGSAANLPCLSGYESLEPIGRGGMGVVYKARQVALDRVVALKMILGSPFGDSEERRRFLAEAHTMARAPHANIVQIYEIGELQGQPYLVLEYVDNGTLAQRLKRQPLSVPEAARLTALLGRAIHAAHGVGVVHRDLKPDNILLTADGTPKISDFGVAKYLDEAVPRTQTGAILGTPAYMAPEQAAGNSHEVGPPCDVYALGTILYELLTGRVPFPGTSRQSVLWKVLHEEPTPPRRLRSRLPRDLQTICLKCLEKRPQRRYGSGLELAEDLERFLAGKPLRARPGPVWERALKWVRRHPAFAGLLAITLLATLVVLGAWIGLTVHLHNTLEKREEDLQQLAETHRQELLQDMRRKQYTTDIRQAAQLQQLGELTRCSDFLMAQQAVGEENELCGFEWGYLRRWSHCPPVELRGQGINGSWVRYHPDGARLASCLGRNAIGLWDVRTGALRGTFTGHKDSVLCFAFSPDGHTLASGGLDGTLRLWNVQDQRPLATLVANKGSVRAVEFSPDGYCLAFAPDWGSEVCLWDLRAGRVRHSWRMPEDMMLSALVFAPDGGTLAASYAAGVVKLWDVPSRQETGSWLFESAPGALAFAPHGPVLAVGLATGEVALYDVRTQQRVAILAGQGKSAGRLAFSPDGRMLLSSGQDEGAIRLWDLASQRPCAILRSRGRGIGSVAFRPDGTAFAVGLSDGPVWIWGLEHLPALPVSRLDSAVVPDGPIAFSPDGKRLAVAGMDHAVHLLATDSGQVERSLPGWYGNWQDLAFAPDGRYLAAAGEDHRVHVWDMSTGRRTAALLGHQDAVTCLAYSRDGKWLASGGRDHRITIWAMPKGEKRYTLQEHGAAITGLSFHPGGTVLASASLDKTVRLWEVPSFAPRHFLDHTEELVGAVFSPDGRLLLANGKTRGPLCWDIVEGRARGRAREFKTLPGRSLTVFPDSRSLAIAIGRGVLLYDVATRREACFIQLRDNDGCRLALAPDGRRLATSKRGGPLAIWDVPRRPNSLVSLLPTPYRVRQWPSTPPPSISSLLFTPDGDTLITASKERAQTSVRREGAILGAVHDHHPVRRITDQVRCWPLAGRSQRRILPDALTLSQHPLVALSSDGNILALGANDGTVSLWDLNTGQMRRRLLVSRHSRTYYPFREKLLMQGVALSPKLDLDTLRALSFSPDGRLLGAVCEDEQITLWETSSGRQLATLPGKHTSACCLAFSSDGSTLATHNGTTIELWDVSRSPEPPVLRRSLHGHTDRVCCLAFAAGDQLLASGARDWQIRLWDVPGGKEGKVLQGHLADVSALAFSRDGKTLASGSWDGTVRLWQAATGQELMILTRAAQRIHALAFSADGSTLAAGGEGVNGRGALWLWQNTPPPPAARTTERARQ